MSNSYHGNTSSSINNDTNTLIQMSSSLIENVNSDQNGGLMVQSMDSTISSSPLSRSSSSDTANTRCIVPQLNDQHVRQSSPLVAASKMVPVPESLMSPDCPPLSVSTVQQRPTSNIPTHTNTSPNNKLTPLKSNKGTLISLSSKPFRNQSNLFFVFPESKLTSPKINRATSAKRQEKSPVLNVRKNNSINAALKASASALHENNTKLPPKSATHSAVQHHTNTANVSNQSSHRDTPDNMSAVSSDDDSDHINVDKLKTIRSKAAAQKYVQIVLIHLVNLTMSMSTNCHSSRSHAHVQHNNQSKDRVDANADSQDTSMPKSPENSAILIQKMWRGYNTRKQTKYIAENLHKARTQEYIE